MKSQYFYVFFFVLISLVMNYSPANCSSDSSQSAEEIFLQANKPFAGDYDQLRERRYIRFLVPYSKTFFFFDGATPRGLSYEIIQEFEKYVNIKEKTGTVKIHALILPTAREELFSNLLKGFGDVAVGNLTITDKRLKMVDFSDPVGKGVREVLVTAKKHPAVQSIENISGKEIHVRKSSSYYEHLVKYNKNLTSQNVPPIKIQLVDDNLEDEDILEMINAGMIERTIIDSHKAQFWAKIFDNITIQENATINEGGKIGWAMRKNSPQLKKLINGFVAKNKKGTLMGNILFNRYLKDTKYITNSLQTDNIERYNGLSPHFSRFGQQYNIDHLFLAAVGYQESRLDQSTVSHAGAVGVMQLLPSTASDKNIGITDITKVDKNIHAGAKYLRFLEDRYFPESEHIDPLNRMFFAIASYNAGPAKIAQLRKEATKKGLDPNKWFHNVEIIAAKRIGRETVQYVSNILKYYVGYTMMREKLNGDN